MLNVTFGPSAVPPPFKSVLFWLFVNVRPISVLGVTGVPAGVVILNTIVPV
jgi:hypothetical protein